jgi:hypothetical protein
MSGKARRAGPMGCPPPRLLVSGPLPCEVGKKGPSYTIPPLTHEAASAAPPARAGGGRWWRTGRLAGYIVGGFVSG